MNKIKMSELKSGDKFQFEYSITNRISFIVKSISKIKIIYYKSYDNGKFKKLKSKEIIGNVFKL